MAFINQLLKKKIIDKKIFESLKGEIKSSGRTLEELILERNLMPESELFKLKSERLNIPFKEFSPKDISVEILELIPRDSAEHYKMIPLAMEDKMLEVGMIYPEDLKAQEALNFLARRRNFNYRVSLITLSHFQEFLKQYQTLGKEVKIALRELEQQLQPGRKELTPKNTSEIVQKRGDAPISKTVAVILKHAVEGQASDIHIEPLRKTTRVRFRLDGILHSSLLLPKEVHVSIVARIKIISKLKIDETRIPQDGRFSIVMDGQDIDFRVSTFPTTLGEKVVMRVLNSSQRLINFKNLGLEGKNLEIIKRAEKKPFGMILVTGPTGSGKTTTLYTILNSINKEGVNIVTLEDPVEYFIAGVSQSQVKPEIGYSFSSGLRHVLRQDPDIIMVGEIRDSETADLATHASLTGHVVLSTIHTNNALGAIPRMIDLGVKPFLLPSTINIVIAQRLARRLCPHCRRKIRPGVKARELIVKELDSLSPEIRADYGKIEDIAIWEAVGCNQCGGSGYSGRVGLFEVLEMSRELGEIILLEPTERKIAEEAKRQGMVNIRQDAILKMLRGEITIEEVVRTTSTS
jgi:type IV pilus assembly protein PilB